MNKKMCNLSMIVLLIGMASLASAFSFSDLFSIFGVSSEDSGQGDSVHNTDITAPEITNSYVQPTNVRPGNTMLVSAEIKDNYGISEVAADMGGIATMPLLLRNGTIYNGVWQNNWLVHDTFPID